MVQRRSVFSASCGAVLIASVAPAQQQPTEGAATLEEVIVTAQKREESAEKTPVSMTVFTGDTLLSEGVANLQTLSNVEPSINFTVTDGGAYIALRGIASTDITETGDPAIAISRDGFFTNRSFGLFASMYDVARVEVLKGPQGTLYGRNSAGGVINIISQRPTDTFGGYALVDTGNYDALHVEGALNIPLADHVQMRVSGESIYHNGYRDNPGFGRGDTADNRSERLQLSFQPWSGFNGWLSVQADRAFDSDVTYSGPLGTSGYGVVGGLTPAVPYQFASSFPIYAPFATDIRETRYRWEFSQEGLPGNTAVTFLGGYDSTSYQHSNDVTAYPGSANPVTQFNQNQNPGTQNEELRLSGRPTDRLFWQVGGFYFREVNSPLTSFAKVESGAFADLHLIDFRYALDTSSRAGFGQLEYKLTDTFKVSGGLRYTEDNKQRTGFAYLNCQIAGVPAFLWPVLGCSGTPPILTTPGNGNIDENKLTYHLGIDWSPTDKTLIYAKYDTGYKAGGFNSNGSAASVDYGPETVKSFEVGTKNRFWGNRLEADLALFDMKYSGYQASQATQLVAGGVSGIFNAGDATVYGAEGQLIALVGESTRLDLGLTLLHAKFTGGSALDASTNMTQPLDGDYLPNAPTVAAHAGLEHTFSLPVDAGLVVRLEGKYQSRYYYDIFNHPDTSQEAYVTGDASVTYLPNAGKWSVQGYVRNLSDRAVLAFAGRDPAFNRNDYEFAPPRVFGLMITGRF